MQHIQREREREIYIHIYMWPRPFGSISRPALSQARSGRINIGNITSTTSRLYLITLFVVFAFL